MHENGIEPVLVTDCLENVELDEGKAVSLAILELLKELALCLVIQVGILGVLDVSQPDGRIDNLRLGLHRAAHALVDGELHVVFGSSPR